MVDFLGSYCEVPFEDDEFLVEEVANISLSSPQSRDCSIQRDAAEIPQQSELDDEEYLSSRLASRVQRRSISVHDQCSLKRICSTASAPEPESLNILGHHDDDDGWSLPILNEADYEEFCPVSVASMSMFNEVPSMVSVQLMQSGANKRANRVTELAKLGSAHTRADVTQRTLPRENQSLFGNTTRRTATTQPQMGVAGTDLPSGNRGLFDVFRRRHGTESRIKIKGLSSSPVSTRSLKSALGSRR